MSSIPAVVIARSALRDEAIHILKNTGLLHPRKPWVRNDDPVFSSLAWRLSPLWERSLRWFYAAG